MNTVTQTRNATPAATTSEAARNEQSERNEFALLPPVDVLEDASGITLYADMPGVDKDHVHLRVVGEQLTLEGEMSLAPPQGMAATHAEVQRSRYRRAFTLSKEVDADKVSAELSQGVLRVRIPKTPHAQPRRVQVQVG